MTKKASIRKATVPKENTTSIRKTNTKRNTNSMMNSMKVATKKNTENSTTKTVLRKAVLVKEPITNLTTMRIITARKVTMKTENITTTAKDTMWPMAMTSITNTKPSMERKVAIKIRRNGAIKAAEVPVGRAGKEDMLLLITRMAIIVLLTKLWITMKAIMLVFPSIVIHITLLLITKKKDDRILSRYRFFLIC